jgi:hypothetical protein
MHDEYRTRRLRIDWKHKARLFWILQNAPGGRRAYYLLQRYVTKSIVRSQQPTTVVAAKFIRHVQAFRDHFGPLSEARFFEFGAGWDLYSNIVLYCYGLNDQTSVDLNPYAQRSCINPVISHLRSDPPPGACRLPDHLLGPRVADDLKRFYGIRYLAPADAARTTFADASIDLIATTSTLEHIPRDQIAAILKECRRLCHAKSVVSMSVDYSDHYAHTDHSISLYNYLSYSEPEWARLNPSVHYQNRLRHRDYRDLFEKAGFDVISESTEIPEDAERQLARISISDHFMGYSEDELKPLGGHFVCRPA